MKIKTLWKVPTELGVYGQAIWKRVGKQLVKDESLDDLDRETFQTLCSNYDRMRFADDEIKTDGLTIDDGRGVKKKHPAFAIWKTSQDNYVRLLSHFGLSPHSRGKKVEPKQEETIDGKKRFF